MSMYSYHVIITFCHKLEKFKKKIAKLVIIQAFNWLSKHVVNYFMYEWVLLCASIINIEPMSWV